MTAVKAEGQRYHWMELNDSIQAFIAGQQGMLSQPRPLMNLCRASVRRYIGPGWAALSAFNQLPVPEKLRDFLALKEELEEKGSGQEHSASSEASPTSRDTEQTSSPTSS